MIEVGSSWSRILQILLIPKTLLMFFTFSATQTEASTKQHFFSSDLCFLQSMRYYGATAAMHYPESSGLFSVLLFLSSFTPLWSCFPWKHCLLLAYNVLKEHQRNTSSCDLTDDYHRHSGMWESDTGYNEMM